MATEQQKINKADLGVPRNRERKIRICQELAWWSSSAICAANEGGCSCGVGSSRDSKFTCLEVHCCLLHCIEICGRPSRAVVVHRGRSSKTSFLGVTSSLRLNVVNCKQHTSWPSFGQLLLPKIFWNPQAVLPDFDIMLLTQNQSKGGPRRYECTLFHAGLRNEIKLRGNNLNENTGPH